MFFSKKLKNQIQALEAENEALKAKYENKIIDDKANAEYKKKLEEEAIESAELYKKNLDALVSKDLNYAFLQQLINASKERDTIIEVTLKDGTVLTIKRDKNNAVPKKTSFYDYANI